jgi:hypothetical protein
MVLSRIRLVATHHKEIVIVDMMSQQPISATDTSTNHEAADPAEGLKLMRLFMSVERKEDRDQLFQLVEKYVELLNRR